MELELINPQSLSLESPQWRATPSTLTTKEFLLAHERGVYTVATWPITRRAPDISPHIQRIHTGLNIMKFDGSETRLVADYQSVEPIKHPKCMITHPDRWKHDYEFIKEPEHVVLAMRDLRDFNITSKVVSSGFEMALSQFAPNADGSHKFLRITLVATYSAKKSLPVILLHACTGGIASLSLCKAFVESVPRRSPLVKDTLWVKERVPLENPAYGEVLLTDPHGFVYEGLTSSFFCAFVNPNGQLTIATAPPTFALEGTLASYVETACAALNIGFVRKLPVIHEASSWTFAFVTNAVRIVSPLSSIHFADGKTIYLDAENKDLKTLCDYVYKLFGLES